MTSDKISKSLEEHSNGGDYGGVAQLGERLLCKQKVIGSIPFTSTKLYREAIVLG